MADNANNVVDYTGFVDGVLRESPDRPNNVINPPVAAVDLPDYLMKAYDTTGGAPITWYSVGLADYQGLYAPGGTNPTNIGILARF